jgi:hypothetical protein
LKETANRGKKQRISKKIAALTGVKVEEKP